MPIRGLIHDSQAGNHISSLAGILNLIKLGVLKTLRQARSGLGGPGDRRMEETLQSPAHRHNSSGPEDALMLLHRDGRRWDGIG